MDNVMIERLWRSLKYECVYLQAFETGSQARTGIGGWIDYYNTSRPHSAFDGRTPEEVYSGCDAPSPGHALEMAPEALAA
jgi:putative transposase